MSTNSLNLKNFEELSQSILREYGDISEKFHAFQHNNRLDCVSGCGKCCFKPDIYCSPIELLPLALELLRRGEAQAVYDKCLESKEERCPFLHVDNAEKFQGKCTEYAFRPLVCRTFGVSARHGKKNNIEYSVCKTLKEEKATAFQSLVDSNYPHTQADLPYIDSAKHRLTTLDPRFLEEEHTIKDSLKIILEKVLLYASYVE